MSTSASEGGAHPLIHELESFLEPGQLVVDADRLESYRFDQAAFCEAGAPIALVFAKQTADVSATLRAAQRHAVPVVPQGARSGLSGGANAIDGCIILSLERMTAILGFDLENDLVRVQPGVLNAALSSAAADVGRFYPPDPASSEFCTIGGNIATNAGGLCCVKYGVTADYVLALEVVLASGETIRVGQNTVKGVAGYDLRSLFVGSEGTLGVITEATLRLKAATAVPRTLGATFETTEAAAAAVTAVLATGLVPSLLEFVDRTCLRIVEERFRFGFDADCGALVLVQIDDAHESVRDLETSRVVETLTQYGGDVVLAESAEEASVLLAARRQVVPALEEAGATLIDDVCVPRTELVKLVSGVESIAEENQVLIGLVGHAGDGNFHPTIVFDRDDPDAARSAYKAFEEIMQLGLDLGGTITGEHGVGMLKRGLLTRELSEPVVDLQRQVKAVFDPQGLLNPGKVFQA